MSSIRIRHLFLGIVLATIFVRCASIAQPQGGPRDSLPPLIIGTTPGQRSVDFRDKRITLNFNEYVALRDQQKEFLQSPPNPNGSKPTLTVKGRSIQIDFEEPLDSNTTYRLDFGNSIADNNEGNRLGNYAFIFSTGPQLDTLLMSGLTLDAQSRDSVIGALIFFYDAQADSVAGHDSTLFNARPDAVFRSDSSGFFLADILKDKDYRVYAILDKNGNQRYESGTDYVAMLDSAYNPTRMADFDMWIEPAVGRRGPRRQIDPPQLRFDLFLEEPVRRQTILGSSRPERQKLELIFNAIRPAEILSFVPEGIDSTWLTRESGVKGDTVWYWIAPPTREAAAALPDTIRARITYLSQDSLWREVPKSEELTFVHRIVDPTARIRRPTTAYADSVRQAREARRKAKRAARLQKKWLRVARQISRRRGDPRRTDAELLADSTLFEQVDVDTTQVERPSRTDELPVRNPFEFTVMASNPLNPENHIRLLFTYPLRSVDEARIRLTKISEGQSALPSRDRQTTVPDATRPQEETPEPFTVELDSATRRLLTIRADWRANDEYRLLIPDSVLQNIAFQANDTLQSTFKVADSSKFGTVILDLKAAPDRDPGYEYILELQTRDGKTAQRIRHAVPGQRYTLRYLPPATYRLRVTEDRNRNGEWDTGALVERRQPERIRIWEHPASGRDIQAKENWDVAVSVDLHDLFDQP